MITISKGAMALFRKYRRLLKIQEIKHKISTGRLVINYQRLKLETGLKQVTIRAINLELEKSGFITRKILRNKTLVIIINRNKGGKVHMTSKHEYDETLIQDIVKAAWVGYRQAKLNDHNRDKKQKD